MGRWSRVVAYFILIITVFVIVMPVGTAQALSLSRWCKEMGGQQVGSTCTLAAGKMAEVVKSLDVPPGLTLINQGTINNHGTIGISGLVRNEGTINNYGIIRNYGTIINCGFINGNEITGNAPKGC